MKGNAQPKLGPGIFRLAFRDTPIGFRRALPILRLVEHIGLFHRGALCTERVCPKQEHYE